MPRVKLTKSAIDDLPTPAKEVVYWDVACPGFGVKVTPTGRKVFVVLYRTAGAGSRLRKYTIGPYGRVTLHQARVSAQKVFAARLEGRDLATEKRAARKRITVDRVEDLLEAYITQHVSQNRSAGGPRKCCAENLLCGTPGASVLVQNVGTINYRIHAAQKAVLQTSRLSSTNSFTAPAGRRFFSVMHAADPDASPRSTGRARSHARFDRSMPVIISTWAEVTRHRQHPICSRRYRLGSPCRSLIAP
jgi:Arm DNA-binding domain